MRRIAAAPAASMILSAMSAVRRAAECIFVAEHNPCDRDIMLHLAAAYLRLATEFELRHRGSRDVGGAAFCPLSDIGQRKTWARWR